MSPGDKSSDDSNHSPTTNRASNRDVITTTFVTSDLDCSCSEFENEGMTRVIHVDLDLLTPKQLRSQTFKANRVKLTEYHGVA